MLIRMFRSSDGMSLVSCSSCGFSADWLRLGINLRASLAAYDGITPGFFFLTCQFSPGSGSSFVAACFLEVLAIQETTFTYSPLNYKKRILYS